MMMPWNKQSEIAAAPNETAIALRLADGVPVVGSRDIAEQFEKRHDHVLRDIEALRGVSPNVGTPVSAWFIPTSTVNSQNGQTYPAYDMTRDGFTLLAMGWTGERAMKFKVGYIVAFNKMEQELLAAPRRQADYIDARIDRLEVLLSNMAQSQTALMTAFSGVMARLTPPAEPAAEQAEPAEPVTRRRRAAPAVVADPEPAAEGGRYMTAKGWLRETGYSYALKSLLGYRATKLAKEQGITLGKKYHIYKGETQSVNTYPVSLLAHAYTTLGV